MKFENTLFGRDQVQCMTLPTPYGTFQFKIFKGNKRQPWMHLEVINCALACARHRTREGRRGKWLRSITRMFSR